LLSALIGAEGMTAGFGSKRETIRTTKYWVARYERDNEDEPVAVDRVAICYKPGQDKEKKLLDHCYKVFMEIPETWEILVHVGPNETPDSGDQMFARLCRERFDECEASEI
jgi:hypothetical protein